jgi:uncharacterized protein YfaT (DUF1175 family)
MRTTGYFILVILLFCISIANANTVNYDKGEALAYARDYCSDYNSNYQKYPGFDCANFVSQALIKGGLNFDNYPNHNEIGEGTNKGKGGFYGVAKLRDALVMGYCFGKITDPSQAQPGDILFTKDKTHVMIYAGKEYSPKHGRIVPVYYGHSRPVCADTNYKDPDNIWSDVDVYRFWGNDDKCKKCK